MRYLYVITLLFCTNCKAEDSHDELTHFAAHAGIGFAVNTISYGIYNKGLGLDKASSIVLSIATSLAVNAAYKHIEGATTNPTASYVYTGLGAIGSSVTVSVFNW
jgi:hypothetical protein